MKKSKFKQTEQSKLERRAKSLQSALRHGGIRIKRRRVFGNKEAKFEHTILVNETMRIKSDSERINKVLRNEFLHVSKHGTIKSLIYREMLLKNGKTPEQVKAAEAQYDALYGRLEPQGTRYGKLPNRQRPTGDA